MEIPTNLLDYLIQFITPERITRIEEVLEKRTNYITVVLEDIFQPHNASAVIRSCDCFGIQNIHIIENLHQFSISKEVVKGSAKWVDLNTYNENEVNTLEALQQLKSNGYRIVATSPNINGITIDEIDLSKGKIALVFGTEQHGVSDIVIENADEFVTIPMVGFTESFNISVSAAICLNVVSSKLRTSNIDWKLKEEEEKNIKLNWIKQSLPFPEILEREYQSKYV